ALQGNVALADKWAPHYRMENLRVFRELSREAVDRGARLLVWPETALPVNLFWDRQAEQALRQVARRMDAEILTGFQGLAPLPAGSYAYRNSAGLVAPNGAIEGVYSKVHLLPFGEEIPLADLLAPGLEIDLGQSNFTPGSGPRVLTGRRCRLAVFICYEMGFARTVREAAAGGAELLVNITNDGWFGHPVAMELHAALSPMRAAENGLPVVRCGNSGVTALYDARGSVRGRLPTNAPDLLVGSLRLPARASFYARHGGWALPLATILYGVMLVWRLSAAARRKGSAAAR
ncbi:MAG: apolipoprotein N-acyltransferase, partial [Candidatus Krumholzibacteriota bacterium]|nr:apolipoprotein N-acyltransferase [Candidatus Krumholzibacteriota bacterium]